MPMAFSSWSRMKQLCRGIISDPLAPANIDNFLVAWSVTLIRSNVADPMDSRLSRKPWLSKYRGLDEQLNNMVRQILKV